MTNYNKIKLVNQIDNIINEAIADTIIKGLNRYIDLYNRKLITAQEFIDYINSTHDDTINPFKPGDKVS